MPHLTKDDFVEVALHHGLIEMDGGFEGEFFFTDEPNNSYPTSQRFIDVVYKLIALEKQREETALTQAKPSYTALHKDPWKKR